MLFVIARGPDYHSIEMSDKGKKKITKWIMDNRRRIKKTLKGKKNEQY
jgi:hypothetical protein